MKYYPLSSARSAEGKRLREAFIVAGVGK
jgi:hypothetical protein